MSTIQDKLHYLQNNHLSEWLKARQEVENEVSIGNQLFYVCGRLATGFRESSCMKFKNRISSLTLKRLANLIPRQS